MVLTFSAIFELFKDELSVLKSGELHLNTNNVVLLEKLGGHSNFKIRASMKKFEHDVDAGIGPICL